MTGRKVVAPWMPYLIPAYAVQFGPSTCALIDPISRISFFDFAIDSKVPRSDVVKVRICDWARRLTRDRAFIVPRKSKRSKTLCRSDDREGAGHRFGERLTSGGIQ